MAAPKKKFDPDAIMNSPEMKRAMKSSAKTLADGAKYRGKGTVSGDKYNQPAPSKGKDSELVRSTMDLARGMDYVRDRGRKRTKSVNRIIDEASR